MTPYVELAKRFNSSVGTRHFDGVTPETDSVTEPASDHPAFQITLPGVHDSVGGVECALDRVMHRDDGR